LFSCNQSGSSVCVGCFGAVTRDGKQDFHNKLKVEEFHDILYSFRLLLCYWAWLKKDYHWDNSDEAQYQITKVSIAKMLQQLVKCMPRITGNCWNIPKMHEQLHVASNIHLFGLHKNIHTGPTEQNHIELSKTIACRPQLRKSTFDWQVANRLVDKMIIDLALDHILQSAQDIPADKPAPATSLPYLLTSAFVIC
jgi:hypothetical protein